MSWSNRAGASRIDKNQPEVVAALKGAGYSVFATSSTGEGFPDLIVALLVAFVGPYNLLVEVKDGDKPRSKQDLTEPQEEFHAEWQGPIAIVRSGEEALELCQALERGERPGLFRFDMRTKRERRNA